MCYMRLVEAKGFKYQMTLSLIFPRNIFKLDVKNHLGYRIGLKDFEPGRARPQMSD